MNTKLYIFFLFSAFVLNYTYAQQESFFSKREEKITSRLDKNNTKLQFKAWTDKRVYKTDDIVKLVIEANKMFDLDLDLKIPYTENAGKTIVNEIDNGKYWSYYILKLKTLKSRTLKIPRITITIDEKNYTTNKLKVTIFK